MIVFLVGITIGITSLNNPIIVKWTFGSARLIGNQGVFDWAKENDLINMKPEKFEQKKNDPIFIGGFTTASMEHYHYENGE